MLGPVGPAVKSMLARRGYEITRPTAFERSILRSPFEDWFGKDIELFAKVYKSNRATLAEIPEWVRGEDLMNSLWRYGVPEQWDTDQHDRYMTGLNSIQFEPTYTDLIAFICGQFANLSYLEIGVSVGKNFLQIARNFPRASLACLDVERMNPVLAEALGGEFAETKSGKRQTVDTLSGARQKIDLATYASGNTVYLRGDQFSADTWAMLSGRKFNCIFSDGVHSPEALLAELDFLLASDLIDTSGRFVMYWDDLVDIAMQSAFDECATALAKVFGRGWHGLHWIHGTYGSKRLNGLFCSGA